MDWARRHGMAYCPLINEANAFARGELTEQEYADFVYESVSRYKVFVCRSRRNTSLRPLLSSGVYPSPTTVPYASFATDPNMMYRASLLMPSTARWALNPLPPSVPADVRVTIVVLVFPAPGSSNTPLPSASRS